MFSRLVKVFAFGLIHVVVRFLGVETVPGGGRLCQRELRTKKLFRLWYLYLWIKPGPGRQHPAFSLSLWGSQVSHGML